MPDQYDSDIGFNEAFAKAKMSGNIILGASKAFMVYQFAQQARSLKGDVAELGVLRGATARIMVEAVRGTDKKIHLFDTFAGLPEPRSDIDLCQKGQFAADLQGVQSFFADCPNVIFHVGIFPDTTLGLNVNRYAMVHLDGDLYSSTLDGLKYFYPRMVIGGIIVLDDYKFPHAPGVAIALQEFMMDKPERTIVSALDYQAYIIKI